ncbi:MAG: toxin-antitoxin system YwqK family antitoxin, partial [Fusobacteriaceae bacterium]
MKFKSFLVFISFIFFSSTTLSTSLNSSIQEYTNYYDNGKLESKGTVLAGKKIGIWNFYHENGNIAEEHSYIN